ncbi:MAG: hypothetical protein RQ745_02020 [Longimicrobiales bacterium]|nr:hypothetical protein [Longimicrobiales bacterium]
MSIRALGSIPLDRLAETRLRTHHALQALTSFAQAAVDPLDDDQHRNFDWDIGARGFRTRPATADPELSVVFDVPRFAVRVERSDAVLNVIEAHTFGGDVLRERLADAVRSALPEGSIGRFERPEFDLPDHAVSDGTTPFQPDGDALEELARWFTHADLALLRLTDEIDLASDEVRCWPHHFDLGTLFQAVEGSDGGTVGLGFSPGDPGIEHPYWYVRSYPDTTSDEHGALPDLPHGRWKLEGWTGAVLEADEVIAAGDAGAQADASDAFLRATVRAFLERLEG